MGASFVIGLPLQILEFRLWDFRLASGNVHAPDEADNDGNDPEAIHFLASLKTTIFTVLGTSSLPSSSTINVFVCS
jgi:hypothetical protein